MICCQKGKRHADLFDVIQELADLSKRIRRTAIWIAGWALVDDVMSRDEIDMIIGVNVVAGPNVRNDTFKMWWPDPDMFASSALGMGWWSPVAENWYRAQRAKYLNGTAQPRTRNQWRLFLHNWDKRIIHATNGCRGAAAAFLNKYV